MKWQCLLHSFECWWPKPKLARLTSFDKKPTMKIPVVKMCQHQAPDCPEVFLDDAVEPARQVSITDDFGQEVAMSRSQFRVLVAKAKLGQLDKI